jgi:dihydrofolate reductase
MKAIVAMAENRGIGKDRKLPWPSIKDDFKFFKELTTGKILVAGRKTFDVLPPLKNRNLIILSNNYKHYDDGYSPIHNFAFCYRPFELITEYDVCHKGELIVIGGAKTYELFLPYITEFYVTHVKGIFEADTFMPAFEHLFSNQEVIKEFDGHRVIKYSK